MPDSTPLATVVGQSESTEMGPTRTLMHGYRVTFQTRSGHTGSVFVPMTQFTRDNVLSAVRAAATNMETIGGLVIP